jgi:hypothetical protein
MVAHGEREKHPPNASNKRGEKHGKKFVVEF